MLAVVPLYASLQLYHQAGAAVTADNSTGRWCRSMTSSRQSGQIFTSVSHLHSLSHAISQSIHSLLPARYARSCTPRGLTCRWLLTTTWSD